MFYKIILVTLILLRKKKCGERLTAYELHTHEHLAPEALSIENFTTKHATSDQRPVMGITLLS